MKISDLLIALAIIAALVYALAVVVVPVREYRDCYYCHIPVELRADPPLQNHWHDSQSIICDECWAAGYR